MQELNTAFINIGIEEIKYNLYFKGIITAKFSNMEDARKAMNWIKSRMFFGKQLEVNFLVDQAEKSSGSKPMMSTINERVENSDEEEESYHP